MITLTEVAAEKVRSFRQNNDTDTEAVTALRVGVKGGGCSGFRYQLALDYQKEGDTPFVSREELIVVDAESLPYVDGATIDFIEDMMKSGFEVKNPNAVAACGCGSSFRVDNNAPNCGSESAL